MWATILTRVECAGWCPVAGFGAGRTVRGAAGADAIVPTVVAGRVGRPVAAEFTVSFGAVVSEEPNATAAATTSSVGTRTSPSRRRVNTPS